MNLIKQRNYWIATVFEYEYASSIGPCILRSKLVTEQEAWVERAICIETDNTAEWSPNYKDGYSLMYLVDLERQGMPFSENKFIFPNRCIFEIDEFHEATEFSIALRDAYIDDILKENMKMMFDMVHFGHQIVQGVPFLDHLLKLFR